MTEIANLKSSLVQIFNQALPNTLNWENATALKALHKINQELNGVSAAPLGFSIAQVVAIFRETGKTASFCDLKYVCYGVAIPTQDGWCVLSNPALRGKLLRNVENIEEPRKFLRCFQALLSSYLSFPRYDERTLKASHVGWGVLRDWLAHQKKRFQGDPRKPGWVAMLIKHKNLLTDSPCDVYGKDILRGDNSSLEEARQGLGIPGDSWVMEETILSQMRSAANLNETQFKSHIDHLLNIVTGQTPGVVSELLKQRAIAVLISRYARCDSNLEHPALRDAAISIIGNPWLKRSAWDALVVNLKNQPDNDAREMINGWLTRQLITDFFELLSLDGQADQRRLNYWLRFVPEIEGTPWLALGPDAMRNSGKRYRELRKRAMGRLLSLDNPGASNNNAFIMKMGERLVVEFGATGNACYVYPAKPKPFLLEGASISCQDLKDKSLGTAHLHMDGNTQWEQKFDRDIFSKNEYSSIATNKRTAKSRSTPKGPYDFSHVKQYVAKFSIKTEDNRMLGGPFWVLTLINKHPEVDKNLEDWGFKYKAPRGWWKQ